MRKNSVLTSLLECEFNMADYMSEYVRILDREGTILFMNESLIAHLGRDLTGENVLKNDNLQQPMILKRDSYFRVVREERRIHNRIYGVQASPIYDGKDFIGSIEVYQDITEVVETRNHLLELNKKNQQDIDFARRIQHSILPGTGRYGDLVVDYRYLSSESLSGDIFDCIPFDQNKTAIYIADVMGHGVSASFLTMFIYQSVRLLVNSGLYYPDEILQELRFRYNQMNLPGDKYFTCFYAVFDNRDHSFTCANAGHNSMPIILNNQSTLLARASGFPISTIFPDSIYKEQTIQLEEGDQILFYTDGIIEAKNSKGEEFGENKLRRLIRTDYKNMLNTILEEVENFRFGKQEDDICLLLLKVQQKET